MIYITQVHRTRGVNYSIEHVFNIVNDNLKNCIRITKVILPFAYVRPFNLIKNILYARHRCSGVVHIVGEAHYIACFLSTKTIITIHDLSLVDFNRGFKRFFFYYLWYYFPLRKATFITCISQTVKEELIARFPFISNKICTIYDPLDPSFSFKLKEFNTEFPVILHIGTAPNKNLERVIEALKGVRCCLHVIGRKIGKYEKLLQESGIDYIYRSNLSNEEIIQEYESADIISFPSLYEGFGMPIIEGQAIGRVVLTSKLNPMKEIAGTGALFVDPYSVSSIRDGFLSLIKDNELRKELIEKGKANSAKFEASRIADQYYKLYNKALQS